MTWCIYWTHNSGPEPHPEMGWVVAWAAEAGLVDGGELTRDGRRYLRSVGGLP